MRVLVTGGAGFIGSHLVEALAGAGHQPPFSAGVAEFAASPPGRAAAVR